MEYLLNLPEIDKEFFIESMVFNRELKVKYDEMKIKAILTSIFGEGKK